MTQQRSRIVRRQLLALAEEATLYQQAPGAFTEDGFVEGDVVATHIRVVAMPPSEAILARVEPEGARVAGSFTFYVLPEVSVAPLRTGDFPTSRDIIRYRNVNYRVSSTEPWYDAYAMIFAVRLEVQDGPIPAGARSAVRSGGDEALSGGDRVLS